MIFDSISILVNKELNVNNMQENQLYLFKVNNKTISAWLYKGEVVLKQINKNTDPILYGKN